MKKIQFLCPHHRNQLSLEGLKATGIIIKWLAQAEEAQRQQHWQAAYRFYGCCMDLAETLHSLKPEHEHEQLEIYNHYCQAGMGLLTVFANTNNHLWWQFYHMLIQQQLKNWLDLAEENGLCANSLRFNLKTCESLNLNTPEYYSRNMNKQAEDSKNTMQNANVRPFNRRQRKHNRSRMHTFH